MSIAIIYYVISSHRGNAIPAALISLELIIYKINYSLTSPLNILALTSSSSRRGAGTLATPDIMVKR
jgi:hypothetical protein